MASSDESVVRTRLLLDGDGTGDDRRLNQIAKSFIQWVSSKDEDDSETTKEDHRKQHSRLLATLAQCEWIQGKSSLVREMNRKEAENYEKLYEQINGEIVEAEKEIQTTKKELIEARKIRRNRMEYDAMAKIINENPDRETQGKKIEEIKAEIESYKATEAALEDKLESRKKQFHVLVKSILDLQALLEEDTDTSIENGLSSQDTEETDEVMEVN
eukprot:04894.XXX_70099_70801_1 [CDS] Oithona nana genome sequencing.